MPFIETKLNFRLSEEREAALKARFGEAISVFPGKSEYWLMLNFQDDCRMWFRGYDQYPVAMVQVHLFGIPDRTQCAEMTRTVSKILEEELKIAPDHIYVEYVFTEHWGWNGENF